MATIKEIAEKTGFSQSTVSIVLRNRAKERKIPERTQRIILEAARELNYRPSMAARQLRSGEGQESLRIALFWANDFRTPMMVRFLKGLRRKMEELETKINLSIIPYAAGKLNQEDLLLSQSGCHGAIICNASEEDLTFLDQAVLPVPVVLYNRESEKYNTVQMDNEEIGRLAAESLYDSDCRTVRMIASAVSFPGSGDRNAAFEEKARELGVEVLPPLFCESCRREGCSTIMRLERKEIPDGFFCSSDALALGVLRGLHERKIACPETVKVLTIGNGEPEEAAFSIPSLSVISLPMEEMAEECLGLLMDTLKNKSKTCARKLPVRMILRESTEKGL